MFKNVASQFIFVDARDIVADDPKSGDAANITLYITKENGSVIAANGSPSELDATNAKGIYKLALTKAETNGDIILVSGKSSTSGVEISPQVVQTQTVMRGTDAAEIVAAMKAMTGITEGGTWTWEKVLKITTAWIAGNWRVKSSDTTVQELMDAENGTTVILEQSLTRAPGGGQDYRTITVKI